MELQGVGVAVTRWVKAKETVIARDEGQQGRSERGKHWRAHNCMYYHFTNEMSGLITVCENSHLFQFSYSGRQTSLSHCMKTVNLALGTPACTVPTSQLRVEVYTIQCENLRGAGCQTASLLMGRVSHRLT
ncbi:hypothetical protein RRG08_042404 [Elysia crispata]|uniref:Uncharacterized protein n=1 Tax=Elysia crispata TaxID=231223 RepID=A0AAE0ZC86_9GAST|nr:hypothetical protein RRG08_042404 [Elysia crispata]